jgi:hypothetical protein
MDFTVLCINLAQNGVANKLLFPHLSTLCQVGLDGRFGSIVSLNVTPLAGPHLGVEQTKPGESGPSPAELLVPGV